MQHLGQAKSLEEKITFLFSKILPEFNSREIDKDLFEEEKQTALLQTFYHEINKHDVDLEDCGEYKLLRWSDGSIDRLGIRLKAFVEMVNAEVDADTLKGVEIVCGCWYRKDHSKPLTDHEIIETAFHFRKQPLSYALTALRCMSDLVKELRDTYKTLYGDADESDTEEGRRLISMVNGLSGKDVTKWDDVYQLEVKTAFMYLEAAQIEYIKEKHKDSL